MLNTLRSELLKYRRSFARRLIVLAPLFFLLSVIPQKLLPSATHITSWELLLSQVFNLWPVIFIPLGTALLAALVQMQEARAGKYRGLRAHPVSPAALWIAKIGGVALYLLLAALVLIVITLLKGWLTASGAAPWPKIVSSALAIWWVGLALIPLQLLAAAWKGLAGSMILGFLGLITGVVAAPKPYWIFVPWSWALRLMCPLVGTHPNGVLLEAGDPLLDPEVILPG